MSRPGVSFVIPVHNGERHLAAVLDRVLAQADGRPFEVVVVDDGSTDGSRRVLAPYLARGEVRVLEGQKAGAAAALNLGIRACSHPLICQVDQDVLLAPGWMGALVEELSAAEDVAAVQGYFTTPHDAGVLARVSGLDLEERYSRIPGDSLDQVCTGNSLYRKSALERVGLFDPSFGYGYDNDLAYRLTYAGFRLLFRRDARAEHRWRESLPAWLRQQYGVGYGRLDLVAAHPDRASGDKVSTLRMILHVPVFLAAGLLLLLGSGAWAVGLSPTLLLAGSGLLFFSLIAERTWAASRAQRLFGNRAAWLFPVVHLLRDAAWQVALFRWVLDRLRRRPRSPSASMALEAGRG